MPYNTKEKQQAWAKRYYQKNRVWLIRLSKKRSSEHTLEKRLYDKNYRANHRGKIKKYLENWRKENLEYSRRLGREFYRKHKKEISLYKKEYRLKNIEKINLKGKEYVRKNIKKIVFCQNKRRLEKKRLGGNHTFDQWKVLKATYGFACPSCNRVEPAIELTEDHIVPSTKWVRWKILNLPTYGYNDIENIQPLCRSCNASKNDHYIKF